MEHIKQNFSIKDLELLSGIKAHTIRIWEKRYNILTPERTDTNIRTYDIANLQKILNVTFLNEHGYKISRIAKLSNEEISNMVKAVAASASEQSRAINAFKVSMVNFDEATFRRTYNKLAETKSFRQIFHQVFIPLLDEIGLLWQTNTINPVHEHFLVGLIKEKIYLNIAQLDYPENKNEKLFVLFLPENEIHDLGLLYLNYEIKLSGRRTIFLGPSMPMKEMKYILDIHPNPVFISYFTISPRDIDDFIAEFQEELSPDKQRDLLLFGMRIQSLDPMKQPDNIKIYKSIPEFTNELE